MRARRRCSRAATPTGSGRNGCSRTEVARNRAGLVGNVHALRTTLDSERAERLEAEANEVLSRLAVREDGLANWPPEAGGVMEHHRTGEIKVHGVTVARMSRRRLHTWRSSSSSPGRS